MPNNITKQTGIKKHNNTKGDVSEDEVEVGRGRMERVR